MSDVLAMAAREIGHPMAFVVEMESHDGLFHGAKVDSVRSTFAERS